MQNKLEKTVTALLLAFTTGCVATAPAQIETPAGPVRGANCPQLQKDFIAAMDDISARTKATRLMSDKVAMIMQTDKLLRASRSIFMMGRQAENYGNCDFTEFHKRHKALNDELLQHTQDIIENNPPKFGI